MFRGKFETTIDAKGRINLSPYFLDELKKHDKYVFALRDFDKSLSLYPFPLKKIEEEQITFSGRANIKKGVLSVPEALRKYAELKRDIVLVGCGYKIEILNSRIWEEIFEEAKKHYKKIANTLKSLGL